MSIVSNRYNVDQEIWDGWTERQKAMFVGLMLQMEVLCECMVQPDIRMAIAAMAATIYEPIARYDFTND